MMSPYLKTKVVELPTTTIRRHVNALSWPTCVTANRVLLTELFNISRIFGANYRLVGE